MGMRQRTGGTAEAAVVLTVTVKGTAAVPVTDTGLVGLHVACAGAPPQVKFTVPVNPPVGLIWRLYVPVCPAFTVAEVEPPAVAGVSVKVGGAAADAATLKTNASPFEPSIV